MKTLLDNIRVNWPMISLILMAIFSTGGAWNEMSHLRQEQAEAKIKIESISEKVEEVATLKVSVQYIQQDISSLRVSVQDYIREHE